MAEPTRVAAKVTSIFVYPIKSCRGISVYQAPLSSTDHPVITEFQVFSPVNEDENFYLSCLKGTSYSTSYDPVLKSIMSMSISTLICGAQYKNTRIGFRWDRQWLVANSNGRAYTQRVEPKLALVEVELPNNAFSDGWEPNKSSYMVIRAPGMCLLKVPLCKPAAIADGVSVWEWSGSAFDEGDEASKWFSDYLGKPSRLVRFNEVSEIRNVDPNYAPGYKVMFADKYPFLLVSQGSLVGLNNLLKEPIPINRFRPNILVDGCEPFSEDLWKEIRIQKLTFNGVKLCSRCKIPTINQETAIPNSEPTETLKKFRSDKVLRPSKKTQGTTVYFGQNMVCSDSLTRGKGKMITVGDPIYVLKIFSSLADAAA